MCEQVEMEAQEMIKRGGNMVDVNCNLCWKSETGKTIKDYQRSYVHHNTIDNGTSIVLPKRVKMK